MTPTFAEANGLRIHYRLEGKANAPVVMFLHKLGSDRTKGDWDALALKLQERNYAVLSFDFRGHGQSKTILEPEKFWSYSMNTQYLNIRDRKKRVLNYADFQTKYLPCLVNDIVAARYDLDNRNDSGQCNTSNIIVIGAGKHRGQTALAALV